MSDSAVCKRYMKVAFAQTGHREAVMTRLRCKMWVCDYCARKNQWIWRNWLLKRLPEVSQEWWLLTLTANRYRRTAWASMDNIRSVLDTFFKRVKRVFGEIEYVRVYEKHPTSEAVHCHVVICGLSPFVVNGCSSKHRPVSIAVLHRAARDGTWAVKTWFKKTANELEMGYICDVQKIEGDASKATWYVTKYLTKAQEHLHVKGLRHVQVTKGIGSPPKEGENELEWDVAAYITAQMFPAGTKVKDLNTGAIISNDHWEKHSFYPHED